MSLFIISIPLMLVAIGIAVVPLIAMSKKEVRHLMHEAERRLEEHHLVQQARHHQRPASASVSPEGAVHAPGRRDQERHGQQPVLVEST
ncbi:MAG: hypothetical protein ACLPYY_06775 [Acidimicrobiales bacterium]